MQVESIYTEQQIKEIHIYIRNSLLHIEMELDKHGYDPLTVLSIMNYYIEQDRTALEKAIVDIKNGNVQILDDEEEGE
jgi:hypothetical protein